MNSSKYEPLSGIVKSFNRLGWNIPLDKLLAYTGRGSLSVSIQLQHTYICKLNANRTLDKNTVKPFNGFADLPNNKLYPQSVMTITNVIEGDMLPANHVNHIHDTQKSIIPWTNISPILAELSKDLSFLDRKIGPIDRVFIQGEAYQICQSTDNTAVDENLTTDMTDIDAITKVQEQLQITNITPLVADIFIRSDRIAELQKWLESDVQGNALPKEHSRQPTPSYLNKQSPHYAPKLAAAVNAWLAVTSDEKYQDKGKSVKHNLECWLRDHAEQYGLTKGDGQPSNTAINEIAKVANWNPTGGAPKTPGSR